MGLTGAQARKLSLQGTYTTARLPRISVSVKSAS